jgi:hypothetical protein
LTIEAISGNEGPILTRGAFGTEGNKYGFEWGTVIRLKDGYHLFSSEMVGDQRWVIMKLAHRLSPDGVQWQRISTVKESSGDFTGKDPRAAIWVYWSKDLNRWDPDHKAVVLDGQNCKWSHRCIGLPSGIKYKNRLAVWHAPGDNSISHMRRSIDLAFMNLPLNPPE